jgi:ABC-type tungstate transport system substrate-binding protein
MNPWLLLILLALIGVAMLVAARWSVPMTGELQLFRMEEHEGHDMDVLVRAIPLYGRFRIVALDHVDARISNTAARIFVMAYRNLLTGVVRLRVGIRFTALRRGASRDMDEGGRLLILGLDARHVPAQQLPAPTAVLTQPN